MRHPLAFALLLATLPLTATAAASDPIDHHAAAHFLDDYYNAVRRHDMQAVTAMIDDNAAIVVTLSGSDAAQEFTLSRADFLQQLRATWHFASREKYEVGPVTWQDDGRRLQATFQESESRVILDTATGQHNDITLELATTGPVLRIVAMRVHATLW